MNRSTAAIALLWLILTGGELLAMVALRPDHWAVFPLLTAAIAIGVGGSYLFDKYIK